MRRPSPPKKLLADINDKLVPAPEVEAWMRKTFLDESSGLFNDKHAHLNSALLGVLWTNAANDRNMNQVVGQAELCKPPQAIGKWAKVAWFQQQREWFGYLPHFKITLYAPYCLEIDNASFCALVEHELHHCALKGFTKQGVPIWGIKGHDVEEFVDVVERYGTGAAAGQTIALVEAANNKPTIAKAAISGACGTCQLKAA
jgi:hypothetical protein